jgi:hypothetical protein
MKTRRWAESLSSVLFEKKGAYSLKCKKVPCRSGESQEHDQDNEVKASEGELVTVTPQHWRISNQHLGFLNACLQTFHEFHQSSPPFNTQAFITPMMLLELLHCLSCHIASFSKEKWTSCISDERSLTRQWAE